MQPRQEEDDVDVKDKLEKLRANATLADNNMVCREKEFKKA